MEKMDKMVSSVDTLMETLISSCLLFNTVRLILLSRQLASYVNQMSFVLLLQEKMVVME